MKKGVKITVTVVVGIILLISLTLNVVLGIECELIQEPKFISGKMNETWRKTDCTIYYHEIDYNRYYSNDGDFITNIDLEYGNDPNYYKISYDQEFNPFDDLEVYFVIETSDENRFPTSIETSHTDLDKDYILFQSSFTKRNLRIVEVWVRTVD